MEGNGPVLVPGLSDMIFGSVGRALQVFVRVEEESVTSREEEVGAS